MYFKVNLPFFLFCFSFVTEEILIHPFPDSDGRMQCLPVELNKGKALGNSGERACWLWVISYCLVTSWPYCLVTSWLSEPSKEAGLRASRKVLTQVTSIHFPKPTYHEAERTPLTYRHIWLLGWISSKDKEHTLVRFMLFSVVNYCFLLLKV